MIGGRSSTVYARSEPAVCATWTLENQDAGDIENQIPLTEMETDLEVVRRDPTFDPRPNALSRHASRQAPAFSTMTDVTGQIKNYDDFDIMLQIEKIYNKLEKIRGKLEFDMEFCPNYWTVQSIQNPLELDLDGMGTRSYIYQFMMDDEFSVGSMLYYYTVILMVFISITSLLVEDSDCCRGPESDSFPYTRWQSIEMIITVFFTLEYFLIISIVRNTHRYVTSIIPVFDFLAILPFYIDLILVEGFGENYRWTKLIRLLRIARLARIRNTSNPYVLIIGRTLWGIRSVLGGMLSYLGIGSLVIGTIANVLEPHTFTSVPIGAWYGIVTLTTVGYGDMYPTSAEGRIMGSFVVVLGLVLCSIVLQSVGQIYNDEIEKLKDDYNEIKQCLFEQEQLVIRHGDDLAIAPQVEFEDMMKTCIDSDYCYPEISRLCRQIKQRRTDFLGSSSGGEFGGTSFTTIQSIPFM